MTKYNQLRSSIRRFAGLLFLVSSLTQGQSDFQNWAQASGRYHLDSTSSIQALAQWRFGRGTADQLLTDLNFNHVFTEFYLDGGLGTLSRTHSLFTQLEWRPWVGIGTTCNCGGLPWTHRLRVEMRFLSGISEMLVRLRYLTGVEFGSLSDSTLHPFVDDEIFLHVNSASTGPASGFDQNRFRFGLRWKMQSDLNIEFSYLNVVSHRPTSTLMVHSPFIGFSFDFGPNRN